MNFAGRVAGWVTMYQKTSYQINLYSGCHPLLKIDRWHATRATRSNGGPVTWAFMNTANILVVIPTYNEHRIAVLDIDIRCYKYIWSISENGTQLIQWCRYYYIPFACLWSKTAILTEVWRNKNMQTRPWSSQALIPHSWAFQKGI